MLEVEIYKAKKGEVNKMLSNLSNIPPCPGIMQPLSFIFNFLFIKDSIRSPMTANIEIIVARIIIANKLMFLENK